MRKGRPERDEGSSVRPGERTFTDRSGRVHHLGKSASASPHRTPHASSAQSSAHLGPHSTPPAPKKSQRWREREEETSRSRGGSRPPRGKRESRPFRGHTTTAKAIVDKNHKGFAFLGFEDRRREDAFLNPRQAENLFHGDRVEAVLDDQGRVIDVRVLEHRFRELVGRFIRRPGQEDRPHGWVIYERKKAREEVFIPKPPAEAKIGDWVRARLDFSGKSGIGVSGEITAVLGATLPASADIAMVAAEYNLTEAHTEKAEREARALTLDLSEVESGLRTDLRHIPFITIDGETARDFDDAVYVERAGSGYVLWVAIADVSSYVVPGTALDDEALSRGTSVYFPERAFHMLPRALSENLCSLRPNEPRLAFVAKIAMDSKGRRGRVELIEGVIESRRRATYTEIQKEFEAAGGRTGSPTWEYRAAFELYEHLKQRRLGRGSIDFDLPEASVRVDAEGNPVAIVRHPRQDAHRLIEEFMIAANEAVTAWALERRWPFIYRVHEEPAETSLLRFQTLAKHLGLHIRLDSDLPLPRILGDLIRKLDGHPAQTLLNTALLRSLKQAIYTSTHSGHFGLASEGYTHFTSPIRRYPDLVVHRLLRQALRIENGKLKKLHPSERDSLEKKLEEVAEHCSYRERIAAEADRDAVKLKQVRFAHAHLGHEVEGQVNGMIDSGLFVQLAEPFLEGMLPLEAIPGDFYRFDEEKMRVLGQRTRRLIQIGDKVKVRIARADIDTRQIDLALVEFLTDHRVSPAEARITPKETSRGRFGKSSRDDQRGSEGRRSGRGDRAERPREDWRGGGKKRPERAGKGRGRPGKGR
jgi:ribonuclease R